MNVMNAQLLRIALVAVFIQMAGLLSAQSDFRFHLVEVPLTGFQGVQSFVLGEYNGLWLVTGGRTDGLHRRQPFAAFDAAGGNNQLQVINPETGQVWSVSSSTFSPPVAEQLAATNIQFFQQDSMLYLIGGYGYSALEGDHITFPNLIAIRLPAAIRAIQEGVSPVSFIRQSAPDERLRVTGGVLLNMQGTYYLAGGQKFMGRYNPMGPSHGPGFEQEYTDAIRRFNISDNGTDLFISNFSEWTSAQHLHRRDYNAVPQVFPDGRTGFTMFSGVFQPDVDLPWLNTVDVDSTGYSVNNQFSQLLNQYHTAHLPVYDASVNAMHTVFFGGIGRYYVDSATGLLKDDPNVPFVRTISRVTRYSNGTMDEVKTGDMPGLMGSGAEFVPLSDADFYDENGILQLQQTPDSMLVGHIIGGIHSTAPNIFFTNTGTESTASARLYRVYLVKGTTTGETFPETVSTGLTLNVTPNPVTDDAVIGIELMEKSKVSIRVTDSFGRLLLFVNDRDLEAGKQQIPLHLGFLPRGTCVATVTVNGKAAGSVKLSRK
jgi:hypothetical protein